MINITVGILTLNSESVIRNALESAKEFSEIIVCDGGSSDKTLKIARKYNCKIIFQKKKFKFSNKTIKNFSGVRNQILSKSVNKYVFFLDSDEIINKNLKYYLKNRIANNIKSNLGIGLVSRKYRLKNKIINYAITYPNFHPRLVNRNAVSEFIKFVHEKPLLKNDKFEVLKIPKLCFIIVPISENPKYLINKFIYYTSIEILMLARSTFYQFFKFINYRLLVLCLFIARLIRNIFIFKNNKMPLDYELVLIYAYFKNIFVLFFKYLSNTK
jgi:glycosyltransferase involved in cell wall biosynthesis